jgi:hypothetical protein
VTDEVLPDTDILSSVMRMDRAFATLVLECEARLATACQDPF